MKWRQSLLLLSILVLLTGCATVPTGPTVMVVPGRDKPFEVFMTDDTACRQWASGQIGGVSPSQRANQNLATGAAVGTAVGAGLGAAMGSASGHAGGGAAVGAGIGLLGGTAMGSNAAYITESQLQRRYNIAYAQCMYAKGNEIPGVIRRPAELYAPPPPERASGPWVTVPGQYVDGAWVPEHMVRMPARSREETLPSGPPPSTPSPVR
ncbi:MAG TPA: hypothetical protein VMT62_05710 [Syntrophorhabdaceae bacterium]|nr:hypothetical protein [Syntrophorhabdaceae bacterium]